MLNFQVQLTLFFPSVTTTKRPTRQRQPPTTTTNHHHLHHRTAMVTTAITTTRATATVTTKRDHHLNHQYPERTGVHDTAHQQRENGCTEGTPVFFIDSTDYPLQDDKEGTPSSSRFFVQNPDDHVKGAHPPRHYHVTTGPPRTKRKTEGPAMSQKAGVQGTPILVIYFPTDDSSSAMSPPPSLDGGPPRHRAGVQHMFAYIYF